MHEKVALDGEPSCSREGDMDYDVFVSGEDEVLIIKRDESGIYHTEAVVIDEGDLFGPSQQKKVEKALVIRDALNNA